MAINTKRVKGRRVVRYNSLQQFLDDAERLADLPVKPLGNWTQGQIYQHLADSLDSSIDGVSFSLPAPARWVLTLLMKRKFLYKELPPGFKNEEADNLRSDITTQDGLQALRSAIQRQDLEADRAPHPAFGKIGRAGWGLFHLRHAEMHMSFLTER